MEMEKAMVVKAEAMDMPKPNIPIEMEKVK